jgi:hypothetical protein
MMTNAGTTVPEGSDLIRPDSLRGGGDEHQTRYGLAQNTRSIAKVGSFHVTDALASFSRTDRIQTRHQHGVLAGQPKGGFCERKEAICSLD